MPKKRTLILIAIIVLLIILVPILAVLQSRNAVADDKDATTSLTVWQIDGFEGGRGSRAKYLQTAGEKCFKNQKVYVTVTSLSADAARANLEQRKIPDIISYSAGFYGLENYINKKDFTFKTWCRGGYCLLTLDPNSDFSDISAENTVVNAGKDNLSAVAAVLCGICGAHLDEPTNAYLDLLNGKYKYLLGTQRDIFRLKTRNVEFAVKPIAEFNDLYQNVSILTQNANRYNLCYKFINYILENNEAESLGLFCGNGKVIADELKPMLEIKFERTLNYPCGKEYLDELNGAAASGDVNKIKNLLK